MATSFNIELFYTHISNHPCVCGSKGGVVHHEHFVYDNETKIRKVCHNCEKNIDITVCATNFRVNMNDNLRMINNKILEEYNRPKEQHFRHIKV